MFGEGNNIKDSKAGLSIIIKDSPTLISYSRTNKLITALYMVTDIMDKDEPLRNKLRTLGIEIISDINVFPTNALSKLSETMSFLNIASAVNIISEMNCSILQKEFEELEQSIKDSIDVKKIPSSKLDLSEFFQKTLPGTAVNRSFQKDTIPESSTSLGIQKGSTLMDALSKARIDSIKDNRNNTLQNQAETKRHRREEILKIIKSASDGVVIKDIKDKAENNPDKFASIINCSDKTLQRELVAMVKEGVLDKHGEKRWSRYFLRKVGI